MIIRKLKLAVYNYAKKLSLLIIPDRFRCFFVYTTPVQMIYFDGVLKNLSEWDFNKICIQVKCVYK